MDLLSLALGGAGMVLLAVVGLVVKQVLAKILSSSSSGSGPGIVITNTGSSAAAEADNTARHSIAPTPTTSAPSFAGLEGETTPERVTAVRCEQLRVQLEGKLEARSDKAIGRLEGKMDGMLVEQRRMNDLLIRLATLQEEAAKREDGLGKRVERLESGARMPAARR